MMYYIAIYKPPIWINIKPKHNNYSRKKVCSI